RGCQHWRSATRSNSRALHKVLILFWMIRLSVSVFANESAFSSWAELCRQALRIRPYDAVTPNVEDRGFRSGRGCGWWLVDRRAHQCCERKEQVGSACNRARA